MPKVRLANDENTPATLELEPGQSRGETLTQLTFDFFEAKEADEERTGFATAIETSSNPR